MVGNINAGSHLTEEIHKILAKYFVQKGGDSKIRTHNRLYKSMNKLKKRREFIRISWWQTCLCPYVLEYLRFSSVIFGNLMFQSVGKMVMPVMCVCINIGLVVLLKPLFLLGWRYATWLVTMLKNSE